TLAFIGVIAWKTDLKQRTFNFSVAVLKMHDRVSNLGSPQAHMVRQLFRSAAAIGALLEEADVAASRRDMAAKQAIALREARESVYWLKLLVAGGAYPDELSPLAREASEFVAMLTVSVKKLRAADLTGPEGSSP